MKTAGTATGTLSKGVGVLSLSLKGMAATMATVLGPIAGLVAVGAVAKSTFTLANSAEVAATQFKVLTGSAEQAATIMKELQQFAASTPLQSAEILDSGRKLLAFGTAAESLQPTLRMLGDLSSGVGIPLTEMAEIFGKMQVQGRIFGEDINQLLGRGIPIVSELAKQFGVAESEIKKLTAEGKIHFTDIQTAMAAMTGEGGKFQGMMSEMSQTTSGKLSTLKDNFSAVLRSIGQLFQPLVNRAIDFATTVIDVSKIAGKFMFDVFAETFGGLFSMFASLVPSFSVFDVLKETIIGIAEAFDVVKIVFLTLRETVLSGLASMLEGSAAFLQPFVDSFFRGFEMIENAMRAFFNNFLTGIQVILSEINKLTGGLDGVISSINNFKVGGATRGSFSVADAGGSVRKLADAAGQSLNEALIAPSLGERLRQRFEAAGTGVTFEAPKFEGPESSEAGAGSTSTQSTTLGAFVRGSADAVNAIIGAGKGDTANKQLSEAKKQTNILKRIEEKTGGDSGTAVALPA